MGLRAFTVAFFCFMASPAFADIPDRKELDEAIMAYNDSVALGHKADSFLHAQRAYLIARKLFDDTPAELGPIAHTYARAAARYKEPVALSLFQQSLDLLEDAHGTKSHLLVPVLIDAGEEALYRNEPEKAYAWFKNAGELQSRHTLGGSFAVARVYMGLARLYLDSGELDRAEEKAEQSLKTAQAHEHKVSYPDNAQLYFWYGQIMRKLGFFERAKSTYTKALEIYLIKEPRARPVVSIHRHMVEVNHQLGNSEEAVSHCIAAQQWENVRNMGNWLPIYDPAGRLSQFHKPKTGQILAGFNRNANCRISDIVIYKTVGITEREAKQLLQQAYFAPRLKNGKIADKQEVQQINIDVY